jgi:biotin carboxyl carrier protein
MSLYTVTIEDRQYQVNISGSRCTVDGEAVHATVLPLNAHGLHLLRQGRQAFELFLTAQDADTYEMFMDGGRRIVTRITDPARRHAQQGGAEESGKSLCAPMHGLVVDVAARLGQEVEKGQTLVVLESMKMQMQLRAPRVGKVLKINVQAGSQVEKGAVLVEFED